jgi:3-deoxy-D-manno-octulosonate 8-phosphate phosphatase (KDO 8-P phosphatase)
MEKPVASNISLIVYDFDGVMTDNKVYVDQHGTETVRCHRGDGLAVNLIKEMGIAQIILSTETNSVVAARAGKIGLDAIHGVGDKLSVLKKYCTENNVELADVLYVGNDINDLYAMRAVGFPVCPADAQHSIRAIAKLQTKAGGGQGVVRELADLLADGEEIQG